MSLVIDIETLGRDDAAEYLDAVSAPSNYKDPEKIRAYIETAKAEQVEKAAVCCDLNRILVIGMFDPQTGSLGQWECQDETEEEVVLAQFWCDLERQGKEALITFGGLSFDWPTLARRSQLLGVALPIWFSLDKYRSRLAHGDLARRLTWDGAIGFQRSLRTYCKLFGVPVPADEPDGSEIARLHAEGDWDGIRAKNATDLRLTAALAQRIGMVHQDVSQPVQEAGVF